MRFRIDRQVNLTPGAPLRLAMRPHFPLAFAKDLQARTIDDDVDRPSLVRNAKQNAKFSRPLGQRREVGNRNVDVQQTNQRTAKAFGLTVGQLEQLANRQLALDGRVAVKKRPTNFRGIVRVLPTIQRIFTKPNRDVTSTHKRFVIFSPIGDLVTRFNLCNHRKAPSENQASPFLPDLRSF